jgi:nicotinate-nucleotide pyrophosphorylase (carboxylating)
LKIEVEVQSEEGANEAIEAGADIIMLDNFDGPGLRIAAANLRQQWNLGSTAQGHRNKVLLECSGGLTEENVASYLCNGMPLFNAPNLDIDIYSTSAVHR